MSDKQSDALQNPRVESDLDSRLSDYAPMIESFANAFLENQRQGNATQLQVAKMQLPFEMWPLPIRGIEPTIPLSLPSSRSVCVE